MTDPNDVTSASADPASAVGGPDAADPDAPVRFDTRVAVLVRDDLATWQRLNVTAFLASGVASDPELIGEPYVDADDTGYLPLLRQPVMVFEADSEALAAARAKGVERGMRVAVYTADMFATTHDAANRAAVRRVAGADLDLVGVALHGARNAVDRLVKRARLHG
ncbi:DUF2000 domain-containing protein [Schumannella luteola]|uniref:DUF2000 domain-containing protein n=1 Tax=Schumannella luteola TaxID=472059 RepID=A0A852YAC4_9MICO|nr:DUF2000 domain-containing protein [Schumannella luteola]NYG98310.1 hypothetical protein [Schumannella luteola]TPX05741.1 DUF2000 domain-containing protein [Schumannella luteola]